jgi:hypothetical protein
VPTDSLGNSVTLQDTRSLGAVNDFVEGFIACEARAANVLQLADTDHSPIVQAYCATLHMFAESRAAPFNARPHIERALAGSANPSNCSPRERGFVACIAAWVSGDISKVNLLHAQQAREFPRDLVSVKLGQYHLFNIGDSTGMLRLAQAALPAASDVPYLHGMAAFAWEQCNLLEQAEAAARKAMRMCQNFAYKEPWAHHALAHVMLATGRLREGQTFMNEVSATWTGLNSFMVTHNWWHQALFAIELGQNDEALRLYDEQVWGVVKSYSQDQINAVSLLARLELAGVDVGTRWQEVADYLATRLDDQVLAFLDMQYLYGLARAARPEAQTLMRNIETFARTSHGPSGVWQQVAVPACHGLLAHASGDFALAADKLHAALPGLTEIGGSHAQRDLFEQIYLDALLRAGRWDAAHQTLRPRLAGQAESVRLMRLAKRQSDRQANP